MSQEESSHVHKKDKNIKLKHSFKKRLAILLATGVGIALLAKYGWPSSAHDTQAPVPENKAEEKQATFPPILQTQQESLLMSAINTGDIETVRTIANDTRWSLIKSEHLEYLCKTQCLPHNAIELADLLYTSTNMDVDPSRLIASVCLTNRDKNMMNWLQSKFDIKSGDERYTTALHLVLSRQITWPWRARKLALPLLLQPYPNPFAIDQDLFESVIYHSDLDDQDEKETRNMVFDYASQHVLDHYHRPRLENHLNANDLTCLPDVLWTIVADYATHTAYEPVVMRHIIRMIENKKNLDEMIPILPQCKDEKGHNLLKYVTDNIPSYSRRSFMPRLLNSNIDYFEYCDQHAQDTPLPDLISHDEAAEISLNYFNRDNGLNPTHFHRAFLYTAFQASWPYGWGESDRARQNNFFKLFKKCISTNADILKVHDNNNLSVFDYICGNETVINYLIRNTTNPSMRDKNGNTIFHRLALKVSLPHYLMGDQSEHNENFSYKAAAILLAKYQAHIDHEIQNNEGETALTLLQNMEPPKRVENKKHHQQIITILTAMTRSNTQKIILQTTPLPQELITIITDYMGYPVLSA